MYNSSRHLPGTLYAADVILGFQNQDLEVRAHDPRDFGPLTAAHPPLSSPHAHPFDSARPTFQERYITVHFHGMYFIHLVVCTTQSVVATVSSIGPIVGAVVINRRDRAEIAPRSRLDEDGGEDGGRV